MSYKWLKLNALVRRNADGACIPNDPGNMDWQRFQLEGGIADPADPDPVPPDLSDLSNAQKIQVATAIYFGQLLGKSPAQVKAGIKAVYDALP